MKIPFAEGAPVRAEYALSAPMDGRPICETCGSEHLLFNASVEVGNGEPKLVIYYDQGAVCLTHDQHADVRWISD